MESDYRSSLVLNRANANIRSIAAQLKEDCDTAELRRFYTSLAVFSKKALQTISEAGEAGRRMKLQ